MRLLTYISLFFILSVNAQLTLGGDIMFTDKSGEYFAPRWDANYTPFSGTTNDVPTYKTGALRLFIEVDQGAGESASAWDNWTTQSSVIPAYPVTRTWEPGPSGTGFSQANNTWVWEQEHDGALQVRAWYNDIQANGDASITYAGETALKSVFMNRMAAAVFKAIDNNATRPELDATNGTNPYWTNPTYGTTVRFNPNDDDRGDPWFVSNGKLAKTMKSLSVVGPILEASGDAYYAANKQRVFYWCKGWADITYSCLDNLMKLFFDNDWSTVGATTLHTDHTPSVYNTSDEDVQLYTHYLSAGAGNPQNRIVGLQVAAFNNREWAAANMVLTYGLLFNDQTKITAIENYFKLYIQVATFSDTTPAEMFRGGHNFTTSTSYAWIAANYSHILLAEMTAAAKSWAVAKKNGFPSMASRSMGELFDYTTNEGSNERFNSWPSTSTNGTNKGLESLANTLSKYHRNPGDGGFKGVRLNVNGDDMGTTQVDFRQWSVLSSWYGTGSETWTHAQYQTADGFISQSSSSGGSAGYPSEDGQAWGALRVNGGYVPTHGLFDIWEGGATVSSSAKIRSNLAVMMN